MTLLDLEDLTGCTREELGFTMWYLCERKLTRVSDNTEYCLTAEGVDFVETTLAEGHIDLRAIAAISNPEVTEQTVARAPLQG